MLRTKVWRTNGWAVGRTDKAATIILCSTFREHKKMKILLVNLALLWLTNQNIGLKRLCLCNCKQSSCHAQRLITANYFNTTQKRYKFKMPTLAWSFRHLVSLGLIQQPLNCHHHHQLKRYRVQAARRRNLQSPWLHKTSKKQEDTSNSKPESDEGQTQQE